MVPAPPPFTACASRWNLILFMGHCLIIVASVMILILLAIDSAVLFGTDSTETFFDWLAIVITTFDGWLAVVVLGVFAALCTLALQPENRTKLRLDEYGIHLMPPLLRPIPWSEVLEIKSPTTSASLVTSIAVRLANTSHYRLSSRLMRMTFSINLAVDVLGITIIATSFDRKADDVIAALFAHYQASQNGPDHTTALIPPST